MKEKTNTVVDVQGLTATMESVNASVKEQVINKEVGIEKLKEGWKSVLEALYEENLGYIQEELESGIDNCDISNVNRITEETEKLQEINWNIEECKTIEELKEVDLDYFLNCVVAPGYLYEYATKEAYVNDETATAMVELIKEVA